MGPGQEPVGDEEARRVLREFFRRVLKRDGPGELQRLHDSFRQQFYRTQPWDVVPAVTTEADSAVRGSRRKPASQSDRS